MILCFPFFQKLHRRTAKNDRTDESEQDLQGIPQKCGLFCCRGALFHRNYEYIKALDDISFTIRDGEMVGYIGPNGAGKSSTIKIMSGILTPTDGRCVINGLVPWRDRVRHVQNIGVVFGQRSQLWWDVPVIDSFDLLRDIYGVPEAEYRKNRDMLTQLLDLQTILKTPARQLSLGQRMRCEVAASLLHSPNILFLDEPTIGLDAVSKIAVREFIRSINKEKGTTVILTTHDMQDIEALTDRIILIGKGRILLDGPLQELKRRYAGHKSVTLDFTGTAPELCEGLHYSSSLSGRAVVAVNTEIISVSDAIAWLSSRVSVNDLAVTGASTEEMVLGMYREYRI